MTAGPCCSFHPDKIVFHAKIETTINTGQAFAEKFAVEQSTVSERDISKSTTIVIPPLPVKSQSNDLSLGGADQKVCCLFRPAPQLFGSNSGAPEAFVALRGLPFRGIDAEQAYLADPVDLDRITIIDPADPAADLSRGSAENGAEEETDDQDKGLPAKVGHEGVSLWGQYIFGRKGSSAFQS